MKRINARPIGIAAAGTAGVLALLLVAHSVQVGRTATRLQARAAVAEQSGQTVAALDLLTKYLALRPDDREATARHALLLDQTAATPAARARALAALKKAVQGQPGRTDVRRRLAESLVASGSYKDARIQFRVLVASVPGDAAIAELMGRCEEAAGDAAAAARWFDLALTHDPRRRLSALGLATLGRGPLHAPARADWALDALVKADPKAFDVWLERARYRRTYQLAGADDDLERARVLAPDDPGVLLETVRAARGRGDEQAARSVLDAATARHPGDPQFIQERAALELKAQRPEEAAAVLRRGLIAAPGASALRWSLANLAAGRGDVAELTRQLGRLRADPSGFPPAPLDYLSAWLETFRGRWEAAARTLERIGPGLVVWPEIQARAVELLARCYGQLGDTARQADAIRRASRLDPRHGDSPDLRPYYARFLATARRDPPAAALTLAVFLAKHGRAAEAWRLCDESWEWNRPEDAARAVAAIFQAAPTTTGSNRALQRLDAAANAPDAAAPVLISLASIRELQGRFDDAETSYRRALSRDGNDPVALNNLAVLISLRGGDTRAALKLTDTALARAGANAELLDTRGFVRIASGDAAGAVADLNTAVTSSPTAPIYFHLAQAHFLSRDRPAAAAAFRQAVALGLTDRALHPLERVSYRQVVADLAAK